MCSMRGAPFVRAAQSRNAYPRISTALFAKMQAYRDAKNIADSSRVRHKLTEQEAADERATKKLFLDAYRAFYEAR
jgi:hypothetical protein